MLLISLVKHSIVDDSTFNAGVSDGCKDSVEAAGAILGEADVASKGSMLEGTSVLESLNDCSSHAASKVLALGSNLTSMVAKHGWRKKAGMITGDKVMEIGDRSLTAQVGPLRSQFPTSTVLLDID
jgi:hypothetical protein